MEPFSAPQTRDNQFLEATQFYKEPEAEAAVEIQQTKDLPLYQTPTPELIYRGKEQAVEQPTPTHQTPEFESKKSEQVQQIEKAETAKSIKSKKSGKSDSLNKAQTKKSVKSKKSEKVAAIPED